MEKIFQSNSNQNRVGMAILLSDKIDWIKKYKKIFNETNNDWGEDGWMDR